MQHPEHSDLPWIYQHFDPRFTSLEAILHCCPCCLKYALLFLFLINKFAGGLPRAMGFAKSSKQIQRFLIFQNCHSFCFCFFKARHLVHATVARVDEGFLCLITSKNKQ